MDQPSPTDPEAAYRAFLRTRWAPRAVRLGRHAFVGSLVLAAFDLAAIRLAGGPATVGQVLAARLPWMAIPVLVLPVLRAAPAWRGLPHFVILASVAWTWGNAWAYHAIGLQGTAIQAIALVLCLITAANFLPLRWRGRGAVFAAMALGQVLLDLVWPEVVPLAPRLLADAAVVAVALTLLAVFENFTASQRRGLALRRHLEETVVMVRASRARAEAAAREVGRLAAQVAHDVNNPLSAVKVNVRWLAEPPPGAQEVERAEVLADTLASVERISRIVADLRRQAVASEQGIREGAAAPDQAPGASGPDPRAVS